MHKPWWRRWLGCVTVAVVAVLMYLVLPHCPAFTETVMARGVFRVVAHPLEWLVSALPFSITEVVVLAALPVLLTLLIVWIIRIVRSPHRARTVERGCRFVAWCVAMAALVFMVTDGVNYSRAPLAELMELPDRQYTGAELCTLTADLARRASEAREKLPQDEAGVTALSVSLDEMLTSGDEAYAAARETYPFLVSGTWRVKPVALSHAWSYTGYTGLYCPWLLEANANVDIPACDIGQTVTHELGHTMGFAHEDECNFLAYLACSTSELPDYAYSGYITAYVHCSNALYRYDKNLWKQAYAHCSDGVRRDLTARNTYYHSFEGKTQDAAQKANDTFIKFNGVESGTLSYNEVVALLLRYYDAQGWL